MSLYIRMRFKGAAANLVVVAERESISLYLEDPKTGDLEAPDGAAISWAELEALRAEVTPPPNLARLPIE